jgi:hypothetical protein
MHPRGFEYWELLLVYVDDILIVLHDPHSHLNKLKKQFHMSAIGRPDRYLGANIKKVYIPGDPSGREHWAITSQSYIRNAANNVCEMLQSEGYDLKTMAKTPFPSNY